MENDECTRAGDRIAVAILNYGTSGLLLENLPSLLGELDGLTAAHVVIVDNASPNADGERLAAGVTAMQAGERVEVILSERNAGFAGGKNRAFAAIRKLPWTPKAVLLLNSDAILRKGAVKALLAALDANPQAGLIAPRLEFSDGTPQISCFRCPSPLSELIRGANTGPVTALLRRYDVPLGVDPDPDEIEWVSFACVLLRMAMLDEIGPMDEGFFLYSEDTEYCWRARRAGWRIVHEPRARIVHLRGRSGPAKALAAARARLPAYLYASRTRLFRLLYGRGGPVAANVMWTLGNAVLSLRRLVGDTQWRAADREARDIWTNVLDPLHGDPGNRG